ncbi:collagen alpha-1(III) chain-like [Melospiza melodia melodia]|uniref:collagen alpha-1(III) chain-like n=1 Tax=Melospiza melodia melodia TaxID=1914991 RepID=UPI002FD2875A
MGAPHPFRGTPETTPLQSEGPRGSPWNRGGDGGQRPPLRDPPQGAPKRPPRGGGERHRPRPLEGHRPRPLPQGARTPPPLPGGLTHPPTLVPAPHAPAPPPLRGAPRPARGPIRTSRDTAGAHPRPPPLNPDSGRGPFKWRRRSEPSTRCQPTGGRRRRPIGCAERGTRSHRPRWGLGSRDSLTSGCRGNAERSPELGIGSTARIATGGWKTWGGSTWRSGSRRAGGTEPGAGDGRGLAGHGGVRGGSTMGGAGQNGAPRFPPVPTRPPAKRGADRTEWARHPAPRPPLNPLAAASPGPSPAVVPGGPVRPHRHGLYLHAEGPTRPSPGAATASPKLERLPGAVSDSAAGRGFRGGPGRGTAPGRDRPGRRPHSRHRLPRHPPPVPVLRSRTARRARPCGFPACGHTGEPGAHRERAAELRESRGGSARAVSRPGSRARERSGRGRAAPAPVRRRERRGLGQGGEVKPARGTTRPRSQSARCAPRGRSRLPPHSDGNGLRATRGSPRLEAARSGHGDGEHLEETGSAQAGPPALPGSGALAGVGKPRPDPPRSRRGARRGGTRSAPPLAL